MIFFLIAPGTQISRDCQYSFGRWNNSTWSSPRSWWWESSCAGDYCLVFSIMCSFFWSSWLYILKWFHIFKHLSHLVNDSGYICFLFEGLNAQSFLWYDLHYLWTKYLKKSSVGLMTYSCCSGVYLVLYSSWCGIQSIA